VSAARIRALIAVAGSRIGLCGDCKPGRVCEKHRAEAREVARWSDLLDRDSAP
jgi:hypothetical protein